MNRADSHPPVAVIILAYNGCQTTLNCLASVVQLEYPCYTVTVVDNGSTDGSAEQIRAAFPQVNVIRLEHNIGVTEGYNTGLRWFLEQDYEYGLLLNNDVLLAPDMLRTLVAEAEAHPEAGLLSPKIYLGAPPSRRLYWSGGWLTLSPVGAPTRGYRRYDRGQYNRMCYAQLAASTAVLVRRTMVQDIGLLDPAFYYLCDDFDWSLRAGKKGYRILYVPAAEVWHLESLTIGFLSPRMVYYYVRNMHLLVKRHFPNWWAMRLMLAIQVPLFMLALVLTGKAYGVRAPIWGWLDHRCGRYGKSERPLDHHKPSRSSMGFSSLSGSSVSRVAK